MLMIGIVIHNNNFLIAPLVLNVFQSVQNGVLLPVAWNDDAYVPSAFGRTCAGRAHFPVCASPDMMKFAELRAVIVAMDNERLAAGEEKKVLEMGEHRAVVYPDTLRRAQRALRVGGHYDGDINGKFDPATHSAIIKFQTAKGIPVSGLPGPITLWALLVEK